MEKMWSGPEPQKCVSDFSKEEIPDTFDEGCYDYVDNTDIFWVVGAPSSDMTTQVRRVNIKQIVRSILVLRI